MSASGTLKACGMPTWKIWAMWLTMFCGTGAGAIVGSAAFAPPTNEAEELAAAYGFATIVGLCGGATIAMARDVDSQPRARDAQPREGCARCSLWCEMGGPLQPLHWYWWRGAPAPRTRTASTPRPPLSQPPPRPPL